jgi:D-glycero-beta-D-manno-heptose 1-phosphate adenylyltransferase
MRFSSSKHIAMDVLVHRPWPFGKRIVLTNGCFDILHRGHVEYLEAASQFGDFLIVGVNSDDSVRALKGPSRPINSDVDRARVIAALECVSAVTIFQDTRVVNLLQIVKPHVWVKGGDYNLQTLCKIEVEAAEKVGAEIKFVPMSQGYSTTKTVEKLGVS